jgi:hypothetical protein
MEYQNFRRLKRIIIALIIIFTIIDFIVIGLSINDGLPTCY